MSHDDNIPGLVRRFRGACVAHESAELQHKQALESQREDRDVVIALEADRAKSAKHLRGEIERQLLYRLRHGDAALDALLEQLAKVAP